MVMDKLLYGSSYFFNKEIRSVHSTSLNNKLMVFSWTFVQFIDEFRPTDMNVNAIQKLTSAIYKFQSTLEAVLVYTCNLFVYIIILQKTPYSYPITTLTSSTAIIYINENKGFRLYQ